MIDELARVFAEEGLPPGFDRIELLGALRDHGIGPEEIQRRIQYGKEYLKHPDPEGGQTLRWRINWWRGKRMFRRRYGVFADAYRLAFLLDPSFLLEDDPEHGASR